MPPNTYHLLGEPEKQPWISPDTTSGLVFMTFFIQRPPDFNVSQHGLRCQQGTTIQLYILTTWQIYIYISHMHKKSTSEVSHFARSPPKHDAWKTKILFRMQPLLSNFRYSSSGLGVSIFTNGPRWSCLDLHWFGFSHGPGCFLDSRCQQPKSLDAFRHRVQPQN